MTRSRFSLPAFAGRLLGQRAPSGTEPAAAEPSVPALVPHNEAQLLAYAEKARGQGIGELLLYLTFDCDTDEDAEAALSLDPWLRARGIRAAYAVPGTQLRRAASAYRELRNAGAAFLNHGAEPHAEWKVDRYVPVTFYDQWTMDAVVADIRHADQIVQEVVGERPTGFRAPHFGSYQKPEQLAVVYQTVRDLGYRYCSTTIPQVGLDHGPLVERGGIVEIPLFGSYLAPTTILDSWTYLENRQTFRLGAQYFALFRDTLDFMQAHRLPGVLAYYVDPAHVAGQKPFLDAMDLIAERGIRSVIAEELLAMRKSEA
jgi:peptidoglycan/xylan/chitin deacetylase (PgdA/CDA1 family)